MLKIERLRGFIIRAQSKRDVVHEGDEVMRPKVHPWTALIFIYMVDAVALGLIAYQWPAYAAFDAVEWISTIVFSTLMIASRLMTVTGTKTHGINYGWYMAVEFAVIVSLPIPLACLVHIATVPAGIIERIQQKLPEPFRGPDYNAAASIICAFCAGNVLLYLVGVLGAPWTTLMLLPAAAVFMGIQYLLLMTLVSLDAQVPWHKTGLLHLDSFVGDALMTMLGALIGRLYVLDRSTILLTIVPLVLLQRTLHRIEAAKLADYDSKTSLHNYRYLDKALNDEVRKATQSGRSLSLVFGDMDLLRDINNTYGHLAGDRALQAVAEAFRDNSRQGDVAARFGGEEFVLLLPGTDRDQAWGIAERIRSKIAEQRLETDDGGIFSITISLGVAAFPDHATTVQGLIKAADEAVYSAKHNGRNQVRAYGAGVAV